MITGKRTLLAVVMGLCLGCAAWADEAAGNRPATQPDANAGGQAIRQEILIQAGGQVQVQVQDAGEAKPATQPDPNAGGQVIRQEIRMQVGGQVGVVGQAGGVVTRTMSVGTRDGRAEFKEENSNKHLVVKDKDGKVLFDGDVNTDEQRKKIPEAALVIVKQARDQMGRGMMVGAAGGPAADNGVLIAPVSINNPFDEILDGEGGVEEFSRQVGDFNVKVTVSRDGKHRATITGKDGKPVFTGPTDTDEQWKAIKDVPADVIAEARKMDENLTREAGVKKATTTAPDTK